jgi:hypothetical protein
VKLDLDYEESDITLPALNEILPLISIYSIHLCLDDWIYNNDNDKELKPLLNTMVAQTKILAIGWLVCYQFSWSFELSLSSGTPTVPRGRTKLIGAVFGFTLEEMMECREH